MKRDGVRCQDQHQEKSNTGQSKTGSRQVSPRRLVSLGVALAAAAAAAACVIHTAGAVATPATGGLELDVDRPGSDINSFDLTAPSPELCRDACGADPNCRAFTYVRPGVQGPNARCWLKGAIPSAVPNNCCVSGVRGYAAAPMAAPPPPPPAPTPAPPPRAAPPPPPPPPPSPPLTAPVVRGTPPPVVYQSIPGGGPLEHGTDRPGYDIASFDLPRPEPHLCQRKCLDNPQCRAFTYVRPGVQGANPRCWLKNNVPPAVPNGCCVSGVRPGAVVAPPPPPREHGWEHRDHHDGRGLEHNVDRPGADIQSVDLPRPEPQLCQRACFDNPRCRAFTFVRPGVQGANARCWLKNAVPQPVPNNNCVSGVR